MASGDVLYYAYRLSIFLAPPLAKWRRPLTFYYDLLRVLASTSRVASTGTGGRYEASRIFETVLAVEDHARGTRSSSTGSIWIFLRNAACYGFGARRARAADIRILAYRDITMGVKFDSKASWILDKDP